MRSKGISQHPWFDVKMNMVVLGAQNCDSLKKQQMDFRLPKTYIGVKLQSPIEIALTKPIKAIIKENKKQIENTQI